VTRVELVFVRTEDDILRRPWNERVSINLKSVFRAFQLSTLLVLQNCSHEQYFLMGTVDCGTWKLCAAQIYVETSAVTPK
jgi:hypothetical protein